MVKKWFVSVIDADARRLPPSAQTACGCAVKNVCVHAMRSSLPVGERNAERFAEGNGDTSPGAASRDERQVPLSS